MGLGLFGRKTKEKANMKTTEPLEVEKCKKGLTSISVRILPLQGSCTDLT